MKKLVFLTVIAAAIVATPMSVIAQPRAGATVSVTHPLGISAVFDGREIAMSIPNGSIPNGHVGFEANNGIFRGAALCVSGTGANWSLRRDGTVDLRDPARRPSCAPIDAAGRASVPNPYGTNAVPWIGADSDGDGVIDRIVAWAGRDRLSGLTGS